MAFLCAKNYSNFRKPELKYYVGSLCMNIDATFYGYSIQQCPVNYPTISSPWKKKDSNMSRCIGKLTFFKPDGAKLASWIHLPCDCWFDLHPNTQMRINKILFTCSSSNWSPFVLIHSQSLPHSPRGTSQMPSIWEIPGLKLELLSWVLKFNLQNYWTIADEDLTLLGQVGL